MRLEEGPVRGFRSLLFQGLLVPTALLAARSLPFSAARHVSGLCLWIDSFSKISNTAIRPAGLGVSETGQWDARGEAGRLSRNHMSAGQPTGDHRLSKRSRFEAKVEPAAEGFS
jgi:hypothetical protein